MSEITAQELESRLSAGEPLAVVDIREFPEYRDWHIHGSTNVPVYEALRRGNFDDLAAAAPRLPSDRPIVAVCRGGVVSRRAVAWLREAGFEATSLVGGIRAWGGVWTEARAARPSGECRLIQVRRNGKGCLSYVVAAGGRAIVVDPSVDASAYVAIAGREGLVVEAVIETHVHADHLSRAIELCRATGAKLVLPPNDRVAFAYEPIGHGGRIEIGAAVIEAIATPGHTGESTCYLVAGQALLTGDTLFLDSVGRPDLERGDAGAEAGARSLYRSLHERLLSRDGGEWVYPAHTSLAIGFDGVAFERPLHEIARDLPLLAADEEHFVAAVLAALPRKPPNHTQIISINEGRSDAGAVDPLDLEAGPNRCSVG